MTTTDITRVAFSTTQACVLVEVTAAQIKHWDAKGLVKPSFGVAQGRGSRRLFSYMDLLALRTVKALRDQGVSLQKVSKCVGYLRCKLPDISCPLTFCTLLTDGETVYLLQDEETLIDTVRKQGQQAFVQLSIAALDHDLRSRVIRFSRKRVEEVTVADRAYQVELELDPDCGGYTATVASLPGCVTQGDSLQEVLDMAADAIRCWLEAYDDLADRGVNVPRPKRGKRKATA